MQMLYLQLTTQSLWTAPHSWVTVTYAKRSFSNQGWEKHIPMDTNKHSYLALRKEHHASARSLP